MNAASRRIADKLLDSIEMQTQVSLIGEAVRTYAIFVEACLAKEKDPVPQEITSGHMELLELIDGAILSCGTFPWNPYGTGHDEALMIGHKEKLLSLKLNLINRFAGVEQSGKPDTAIL